MKDLEREFKEIQKNSLPKNLEHWEKKHLLNVLEECRKPGDNLLKRLDYYFLPTSLIRREVSYQFFRNDLECAFPKEFKIDKTEKKLLKKRMQQIYGLENMRSMSYFLATIVLLIKYL